MTALRIYICSLCNLSPTIILLVMVHMKTSEGHLDELEGKAPHLLLHLELI